MSNIWQRTITGIGIVIVIPAAVLLGPYTFLSICVLINFLGVSEFYGLFKIDHPPMRKISGILLSAVLLVSSGLYVMGDADPRVLLINLPLMSIIFIAELFHESDTPFLNLALVFLGIVYITLPVILFFNCSIGFSNKQYHPQIILGYLLLLWANDTGAFLSGSVLGKHSLFLRISPKKTWEGSIGGALLVIAVIVLNSSLFQDISGAGWAIIGVTVIIMGTFGDLVKSLMKRSLNVKDSGTILPGHGGILDRFDSLIGSAPFVYTILVFQQ